MPPKLIWPALGAFLAIAVVLARTPHLPADATTALDPEEQAFLDLLNNYRQQNGVGPLLAEPSLTDAARWMSADMGTHAYFSHTDSLGRNPWDRMAAFGYNYNTWRGENIAAGTSSAQTVFDLWRNSSGHNANMLSSNYRVIGIGRVYTPGSPYGWYWTTDFGGYVPNPSPPPSTPTPTPAPTATPPATPVPTPTPSPSPDPYADPDGDGFPTWVEQRVGTDPFLRCGMPDTNRPTKPSLAWPADLVTDGTYRIDMQDIASFIAPVHRLNTSPGQPGYDPRWDIVPSAGPLSNDINITDLVALIVLKPPMFNGQRAYQGPACQ